MASSQGTSSNTVTDISHVLESLGSLIGELDAIEVEKIDAVNSGANDEDAVDHELSLETLLADTDEFDDSDDQHQLIPHETSSAKSPSPGFFCHGSQHFWQQNFNAATQDNGGSTSGSIYETLVVSTNSNVHTACTSQSQSLQFQNAPFIRTQEHESHYSVPLGKPATIPQSGSLLSHNSALLNTQERDSHYSVLSGSRSKSVSSPLKPNLSRTQVSDSHYTVPPSRGGHKGAFNEVALSGDVHGSFKKVEEGSSTAIAKKEGHAPASHPKAEPNHYVSPGELGLPRQSNQVKKNGMITSTPQVRQERHSAQQVPVNVFNEDSKPNELLVSSGMKAREACHKLALLNEVEDDPQWILVEHLTDLGLERNLEDHENVMAVLHTWAPGSNNKLLFRKDVKKYHFFSHTSNYFPPHLLDSENSDKAVTEKAQKAKTILHQNLFSTCTRVPEIEGTLQCKEFGKKSWNRKFLFLRGSGIYSSVKGKSKASKDLECYVQFDGANLYNILNPKKSHKSPTDCCFCIVPFRARELKELKCFCVEDEKALMSWKMAVRIAKVGPQLRQNYDDMLRKFAKLTKYRDQQTTESNCQNKISEREKGHSRVGDGQVAMDFTGKRGRIITDDKEIQELSNTRNKVGRSRRTSSNNFIPTDTTVPGHHFISEPWYHGRITREVSLALLIDAGVQDGLFLVRESCSLAGVFVLTFCMNKRVYHCQLVQDIGEGTQIFFSLGKGPAFRTLHELIRFYQQKPLNGVSLALRSPCPKQPHVVM